MIAYQVAESQRHIIKVLQLDLFAPISSARPILSCDGETLVLQDSKVPKSICF